MPMRNAGSSDERRRGEQFRSLLAIFSKRQRGQSRNFKINQDVKLIVMRLRKMVLKLDEIIYQFNYLPPEIIHDIEDTMQHLDAV